MKAPTVAHFCEGKTNTEPSPAPNKYHKYTNAKDLLKYPRVWCGKNQRKKREGRVWLSIGNGARLNLPFIFLPQRLQASALFRQNLREIKISVPLSQGQCLRGGFGEWIELKIRRVIKPWNDQTPSEGGGSHLENICHCRNPSLLDRARRIAEIQKRQLLPNYFGQTGHFYASRRGRADEMYLRIRGSLPRHYRWGQNIAFRLYSKSAWKEISIGMYWVGGEPKPELPIVLFGEANKQNLRRIPNGFLGHLPFADKGCVHSSRVPAPR